MFYSRSKKPPAEATEPGSKKQKTYSMTVDLNGHKVLEETGEIDLYEKIQESLEETKIENIVRRAVGGDAQALNVMHGVYADVTDAPRTFAEMQQAVIYATEQFSRLPVEIREKFGHSPEKFVATYGTKEWLEIMTPKGPVDRAAIEENAAKEKGGKSDE